LGQTVQTYINVQIERQPVRALIDTGSDVTIVDSAFAQRMHWPIRPIKIKSVKTASGEGMIIDRICITDLTIGSGDIASTYSSLPTWKDWC